ncbi:hypothetical protein H9Q70_005028 [Fusarium xylarioides]|nr:hypothetical protein H9Q70_005028 [Fusarium xylarioides]KAG5783932.1 hypothetical protein H9Q73_002432 [Fusarium xylarioides]KAG5821606.1 hypothetical protein H9Q71_000137 [Fusarium xylarioides]
MDELHNGASESNGIPSAPIPRMPIVTFLRKNNLPPSSSTGYLPSPSTSSARSTARRRVLDRRVDSLKAERDREVREKRAILDEKRKLESKNAALVLEAQRLRAEKAQM